LYFSKDEVNAVVLDNVQWDGKLKNARGSRNNTFLSGTQMMAHKVRMFRVDSFNEMYVTLTYTSDRDCISPVLMPKYDKVKGSKAKFFISHVKMEPSTSPDKTGERIR